MAQKPLFHIEIDGSAQAARKLRGSREDIVKQFERGLRLSGEIIMGEARDIYVPVDTGTLKSTGHVIGPTTNKRTSIVDLAFGGPAASYALEVHETNKAYNNGKVWKYLQTPAQKFPFEEAMQKFIDVGLI